MRHRGAHDRSGTETAFEAAASSQGSRGDRSIGHPPWRSASPDFDTPAKHPRGGQAGPRSRRHALHADRRHPELRSAIAADATARKGFAVSRDRVIVVPGGKPVMFFAILALIEEGDEVIYPDPGFPIYESMVDYIGGTAVPCPIRQENAFRLDPGGAGLLAPGVPSWSSSTRRPTRRAASRPARISSRSPRSLASTNLVVLADEIYGRTIYEGEHVSDRLAAVQAERTIVLDGFSKTYAMTGWRLGYASCPRSW